MADSSYDPRTLSAPAPARGCSWPALTEAVRDLPGQRPESGQDTCRCPGEQCGPARLLPVASRGCHDPPPGASLPGRTSGLTWAVPVPVGPVPPCSLPRSHPTVSKLEGPAVSRPGPEGAPQSYTFLSVRVKPACLPARLLPDTALRRLLGVSVIYH